MKRVTRRRLAVFFAASVAATASTVSAWEPLTGTKELAPRWYGPLIYRLNEEGSDDLELDVLLPEVHKGMLEWTTADCTGATARYDGLTTELPGTAKEPAADNVIAWRESDWKDGPEAVAVTAPSFISKGSGQPPEIVAATMRLNGQHWTWVTGQTQDHRLNLFSVILHEGGHYWGLEHTPVPMSVMNEEYNHDLTGLAADDREGICSLYPLGEAADCTTQPCSEGYECVDGNCLWDGVGPAPHGCQLDSDCGEAERCDAGACVDDAEMDRPNACVSDGDCAGRNERCVAGRCMLLADPPPAMCTRASECGADEACKAGRCVTAHPTQPVGLPVGSDCVMDSDCESGLCRLAGEDTQCTDFCETDDDCGEAARCLREGTQTGLCGPAELAPEHPSAQPDSTETKRDVESSGCSAVGSWGTATMAWLLLLLPCGLRRVRRALPR